MTAISATRKTTEKTRVLQPISGARIKLAQFLTNRWVVVAPEDLEVADFENPALWTVSRDIKRGDSVVIQQPRRWTELVAYDDGPGYLALRVITTVELPPQREQSSTALPPGYEIRRARAEDDAIGNYVVLREKDNLIMSQHQRLDDFEAARRWLLDHAAVRGPK
jgi:hypothetical protein